MQRMNRFALIGSAYLLTSLLVTNGALYGQAQTGNAAVSQADSRLAAEQSSAGPASTHYRQLQQRLAQGWNTWDVNSVATQVLLPEGLAIHVGLKHNTTESGDAFLQNALIGRLTPDAEQVFPGPHSWDGKYTDLRISWKGSSWRIQSAQDGPDLVLLVTPLPSTPISKLPPTIVFSVDFLWNRPGTALKHPDFIETHGASGLVPVYCTCVTAQTKTADEYIDIPIGGPYFAEDLVEPVGISTGKRRTVSDIKAVISQQEDAYRCFASLPGVERELGRLCDLRLGYIFCGDNGRNWRSGFGVRRCD